MIFMNSLAVINLYLDWILGFQAVGCVQTLVRGVLQ